MSEPGVVTMSVPALESVILCPEPDKNSVDLMKLPEVSAKAVESDISEEDSASDADTDSSKSTANPDPGVSDKHVLAVQKHLAPGVASILSPTEEIVPSFPAVLENNSKPQQEEEPAEEKPVEDVEVAYDGRKPPTPRTTSDICEDIVRVLGRYRLVHQSDTSNEWGTRAKFLAQVERYVVKDEAVSMSLPAFPFKSPNKQTKVLGTLPGKGEDVALSHLEGLCLAIGDVYKPGASVYIVSDGLMYNDILGVPDLEVWRYGQALRKMAKDTGCDHVQFLRLIDLLVGTSSKEPFNEEEYLEAAPSFRDEILTRYLPKDFDTDAYIANDVNATLTYRGYIKFLEIDLAHQLVNETKSQMKKVYESTAKRMIVRGKAFAASIAQNLADHIRLSIHASTEQNKLSMAIVPQLGRSSTPWHAALVRAVDGSITMAHAGSVPAMTHDLIFDQEGRPSYFRERSDLFNWAGMDLEFDYTYPTGIVISPRDPHTRYSFRNVQMQKVRALSEACSPVVLRGFTETTDRHTFEAKAYDAGTVQPWTWGVSVTVKEVIDPGPKASAVTTSEAMPMHYDGFFFFKKEMVDGVEQKVSKVPRFQYFTAITPSPPGDGQTLFANSRLIFQHLPAPYTLAELGNLKWDCRHSSNWNNHMTDLPLVVPHPTNNKPCLRWFEPWYKWMTKFSTSEVNISNGGQHYKDLIREMLYDRRVCLYFNFLQGDILVADNINMMHTRTAFGSDCGRELWRIHFN